VLLTLLVGSCSIAGLAPLLGYSAKKQLESAVPPAITMALVVLSVGSVAVYCRLCRAPLAVPSDTPEASAALPWGAWLLMLPVVGGGALLVAEVQRGWLVSLVLLGLGLALDQLLERRRRQVSHGLPTLDRLPDLLGGLGLVGAGLLLSIGAELG
jgi:multicomponent Na+:H+ antiporter subunit D